MRGKPKKGKQAKRRQRRMKRACFEDGPRFSGAKHTETGWADGVFLLHAGRKNFFDTLRGLLQNRLTKDAGAKGQRKTFCPRVCLYELLFCGNCKAFGRSKADPDSKISAQCG